MTKAFELKPHYVLDPSYNIDGEEVKNWRSSQIIRMHIKNIGGKYASHNNWQIKVVNSEAEARSYFNQIRNKVSFKCFPVQSNMIDEVLIFFEDIDSEWINRSLTKGHAFIMLFEK